MWIFRARVIRVKASATKARRKLDLPMSYFVFSLLLARRKIGDTNWIFPANSESGHIEEPKYPLDLIRAETGIALEPKFMLRIVITTTR